jgi:phospholipid/cholesterol/gamma-HCH transport system permease protein
LSAPIALPKAVATPLREVGSFFAMSLDTFVQAVHPPFAWREFVLQCWFVARVSFVPGLLLTVPFSVIVTFILDILLTEIGAADFSGAGAALGTVTQTGPITSVLVVGGAGATAMCADLGARTIREELDAMRVMGINPIQALVVPRVAALTLNAFLLNSVVCIVGVVGSYFFAVNFQHVTPGAFASSLTLLMGLPAVVTCFIKATLFGLAAGLIACYKGTTVGGGPQGVGNAVNETVVYTFVALFVINTVVTAIGLGATK